MFSFLVFFVEFKKLLENFDKLPFSFFHFVAARIFWSIFNYFSKFRKGTDEDSLNKTKNHITTLKKSSKKKQK
jgi:hypothetical protein